MRAAITAWVKRNLIADNPDQADTSRLDKLDGVTS